MFVYTRAERRMLRLLGEKLFSHLVRLPLKFNLQRRTGGVSGSLDNARQGYQMILQSIVFSVLPVTFDLTLSLAVLPHLVPPVFWVLFAIALAGYAGAFSYSTVSIGGEQRRASTAQINANAVVVEGIMHCEAIKYLRGELMFQERVSRAFAQSRGTMGIGLPKISTQRIGGGDTVRLISWIESCIFGIRSPPRKSAHGQAGHGQRLPVSAIRTRGDVCFCVATNIPGDFHAHGHRGNSPCSGRVGPSPLSDWNGGSESTSQRLGLFTGSTFTLDVGGAPKIQVPTPLDLDKSYVIRLLVEPVYKVGL